MNDLYLAPLVSNDPYYDPIDCNECGESLSPDCVVIVETSDLDEAEPMCAKCAEKAAAEYPGTVHDRREDAEHLIDDLHTWIVKNMHTALDADCECGCWNDVEELLARAEKR